MPKTGNNLTLSRCDVRAAGAVQRAADLGRSHGGVMRKNEHLIISAIIALSAGGSIAASGAIRDRHASADRPGGDRGVLR